jgi:hypothetical protein
VSGRRGGHELTGPGDRSRRESERDLTLTLSLSLSLGPDADALDPRFHCARTHWIRGFMTFQLVRRTRTVLLMVPV